MWIYEDWLENRDFFFIIIIVQETEVSLYEVLKMPVFVNRCLVHRALRNDLEVETNN